MKGRFRSLRWVTVAAMVVPLLALVMPTPASADIDTSCPSLSGKKASTLVSASFTDDGAGTATYFFTSNSDQSPVDGVPGLIRYCVYPGTAVDSVTTTAVGDNGGAWGDPQQKPNFSFDRPDGDPSNIGLDGRTDYEMGTATWTGDVPGNQTILLHINDPAECVALYGGNPGTCFVLPSGSANEATDLGVGKDATPSFDLAYTWNITKTACAHGITPCTDTVKQVGGTVTFDYTIDVTHDAGTPGNWQVNGTITVTNPNTADVTGVDITDSVDNGGDCTVTNGTNLTVDGSGSVQRLYKCTYSSAPTPSAGTNTATASWPDQTLTNNDHLSAGSTPFEKTFDFDLVDPKLIDDCTVVSDTFSGGPQNVTVCVLDSNPPPFTYSRTISVTPGCHDYMNTATETPTVASPRSDAATVTVCGPAATGALTIGFWKTTNGQGLIGTYCQAGGGTTALGTFLATLGTEDQGPFKDAGLQTTCAGMKTYVFNILSGASATDMNKMLKAQMLGTALDVWFSGPGWTSTKSGNVKPPSNFLQHNNLGTFNMDTTAICPMVDNLNTGSANCKLGHPSTDAVAAGAVPTSPMSMQAILDFAASWTPSGAFIANSSPNAWYGTPSTGVNRVKQEILKNIFDQFNNQQAFGSF